MSSISITYPSFTSGTTISSSQVNTNNSDLTTWLNNRNSAATDWDSFSCAASGTFKATTNQLVLGTTHTVTLSATAPAASRTWTLPDLSTNPTFLACEATQIITGSKTFQSAPVISLGNANDTDYSLVTLTGGAADTLFKSFTTTAVDNTGKAIAGTTGQNGFMAIVSGTTGSAAFCDIVVAGDNLSGSPTVVSSTSTLSSPAARTYTMASNKLKVSLATGSYSVHTFIISVG